MLCDITTQNYTLLAHNSVFGWMLNNFVDHEVHLLLVIKNEFVTVTTDMDGKVISRR